MQKLKLDQTEFKTALNNYKHLIDEDIEKFCETATADTNEYFGEYPLEAVKAYCEILNRGGKRIRGALAMNSYYMLGGKDQGVALQAARAIEMLQAYILMVDDIQDRSDTRRSGPTAHIILKNYHELNHLKGDSAHFGSSITMNGFLFGVHSAINVLADLNVDPEYKLAAIKNVNRHFIATAHGQSLDIFNEVIECVDEEAVNNVLLWKTAYYTFMNPLQLGAIIAGANKKDLENLEKYSLDAGRVFQITDDILGTFSKDVDTGKSQMDDIREGKRTLLTVKATELAPKADVYFMIQMLGNTDLTMSEFKRCKEIIVNSGALSYAKSQAENSVVDALKALEENKDGWREEQVDFLTQLVQYLINRKG